MNHGFAKRRSRQANLASETWKRVELLFVVKLLLWQSVNEEGKEKRSSVRLVGKRAAPGWCWVMLRGCKAGGDRPGSSGMRHGLSCFQLMALAVFPELGGWRLSPRAGGV